MTVTALAADGGNNNLQVVFENCAQSFNWISKINNTQIYNTKYNDVVMPMYSLIRYSNDYSEISGS